MRIHLFKPLQGWRAFFGEIAIIVIGVLIALGAQQLVEEWNWGRRLADAERQLQRESRTNAYYAAEMVAARPCIDAQLDRLRTRLLASGTRIVPAPVFTDDFATFVYRQPSRPYLEATWQSLSDDGSTSHLEDWRHGRLSALYSQIANLREMSVQSNLTSGRLMVLSEAVPLDPGTRARLLETIAEQRYRTRLQGVVTAQVMATMRDLGQGLDPARIDRYLATQSGTIKFCRAQKLPLADWRKALAAQPVTGPLDDNDACRARRGSEVSDGRSSSGSSRGFKLTF